MQPAERIFVKRQWKSMERVSQEKIWQILECRGSLLLIGVPQCDPCEYVRNLLALEESKLTRSGWKIYLTYASFRMIEALRVAEISTTFPLVLTRYFDGRIVQFAGADEIEVALAGLFAEVAGASQAIDV